MFQNTYAWSLPSPLVNLVLHNPHNPLESASELDVKVKGGKGARGQHPHVSGASVAGVVQDLACGRADSNTMLT